MLEQFVAFILGSKKAIAGAIVTAAIGYLGRHGLSVSADISEAVRVLLDAFIGGVVVYTTRNRVGAVDRIK